MLMIIDPNTLIPTHTSNILNNRSFPRRSGPLQQNRQISVRNRPQQIHNILPKSLSNQKLFLLRLSKKRALFHLKPEHFHAVSRQLWLLIQQIFVVVASWNAHNGLDLPLEVLLRLLRKSRPEAQVESVVECSFEPVGL